MKAKFAPVTAALLARKGEARPWNKDHVWTVPAPETADLLSRGLAEPCGDPANGKPAFVPPFGIAASSPGVRRLTLRLSQSDYERLGLIATKRDTTRQRILHRLMEEFLAAAAGEYGADCGCIGGSCRRQD